MPFNTTSYFAGVGTVAAALAIGFGGALIVTDTNHKPAAPNRLERVASTVSIAADAAQPATPAAAAQPVTPAAAAPSVAQADTPVRRVDENPLPKSAEQDQAPPPKAQTASVEPAAAPVEAPIKPEAKVSEKPARDSRNVEDRSRETRKASERAERSERRKREQARLERRKQRDQDTPVQDAPAMVQRQAPVVQEAVESSEEPSPRFSFFGED